MDRPAAAQFLLRLFRCSPRRPCLDHPASSSNVFISLSLLPPSSSSSCHPFPTLCSFNRRQCLQRRSYVTRRPPTPDRGPTSDAAAWQQRTSTIPAEMIDEFASYPMLTDPELRRRQARPRKVRMLMRDFIHDSLYNPNYGYFSKQAVIFTPGKTFDFPSLSNEPAFYRELGRRYTEFEDYLDQNVGHDPTRQLWHTPTELFSPHYGETIAEYLVANYRLASFPHKDLVVYELGAGRGTLMLNILDYIRDVDPDVYERTKYRIIEISPALAALQKKQLGLAARRGSGGGGQESGPGMDAGAEEMGRGHLDRVEIITRDIFEWDEHVLSPCYFLAMEVIDNFAHDSIRYNFSTGQPLQSVVVIDDAGDFYELFTPDLDPVAARYFRVRHVATDGRYPRPSLGGGRLSRYLGERSARYGLTGADGPSILDRMSAGLVQAHRALRGWLEPISWLAYPSNLSPPEYLPTRLMQFFDVLEKYFPAHKLVLSDFHALPDAIKGLNAPVVQTRLRRKTVTVTTPLVHQGYFDIFFPTDFSVMEMVYQAITGKLTRVQTHEEFMRNWALLAATATRSGENPLLSHYKNTSVMTTL